MIPTRLFLLAILIAFASPLSAQKREVPYWASIRSEEVNMRVGPSEDFPIDWVYRRKGLPVKVIRVVEAWRYVRDPDGTTGWIIARLLNPKRTAIVVGDGLADMRADMSANAALKWRVQTGVSGGLGACDQGWCEFDVEGRKGWVQQDRLWGTGKP